MARPTKRNPAVEDQILRALAAGQARWPAAALAGISGNTLSRWISDDDAFALEVQRAEAQAVATALGTITKAAASGTWQAAAWWLEGRYPAEWGRNRRADQGPLPDEIVIRWPDETMVG
ncbi:MAG: hypothetical protein FJY99_11460 [Candidatus Sericytochromatia bacterium]|nr:hypothetical protein [Candidatus Tanganyikabacteria bacterium]